MDKKKYTEVKKSFPFFIERIQRYCDGLEDFQRLTGSIRVSDLEGYRTSKDDNGFNAVYRVAGCNLLRNEVFFGFEERVSTEERFSKALAYLAGNMGEDFSVKYFDAGNAERRFEILPFFKPETAEYDDPEGERNKRLREEQERLRPITDFLRERGGTIDGWGGVKGILAVERGEKF